MVSKSARDREEMNLLVDEFLRRGLVPDSVRDTVESLHGKDKTSEALELILDERRETETDDD